MMCRMQPVSELTIKIIVKLQPERFEQLNDKELEEQCMESIRMKVSYKLQ